MVIRLEAFASRLEAIACRLDVITMLGAASGLCPGLRDKVGQVGQLLDSVTNEGEVPKKKHWVT